MDIVPENIPAVGNAPQVGLLFDKYQELKSRAFEGEKAADLIRQVRLNTLVDELQITCSEVVGRELSQRAIVQLANCTATYTSFELSRKVEAVSTPENFAVSQTHKCCLIRDVFSSPAEFNEPTVVWTPNYRELLPIVAHVLNVWDSEVLDELENPELFFRTVFQRHPESMDRVMKALEFAAKPLFTVKNKERSLSDIKKPSLHSFIGSEVTLQSGMNGISVFNRQEMGEGLKGIVHTHCMMQARALAGLELQRAFSSLSNDYTVNYLFSPEKLDYHLKTELQEGSLEHERAVGVDAIVVQARLFTEGLQTSDLLEVVLSKLEERKKAEEKKLSSPLEAYRIEAEESVSTANKQIIAITRHRKYLAKLFRRYTPRQ